MRLGKPARVTLAVVTGLILVAVYVPLLVVLINSFSTSTSLTWPPPGFTLEWWGKAFQSAGAKEAVLTSLQVAVVATLVSLVLGTLISLALQRFSFFGRDAISLLIILPIALPGIITGIALNNFFRTIMGVPLSIWTVVIAHATFCIVTVFNNVIARLRRTGTNLEEASSDLGAGDLDDVPARHLPAAALGAPRRRPAGVRAQLRRDHRDDVHRRIRRHDAADLHPEQHVPAEPGADRQRDRGRAGRRVDRADLHRAAAVGLGAAAALSAAAPTPRRIARRPAAGDGAATRRGCAGASPVRRRRDCPRRSRRRRPRARRA